MTKYAARQRFSGSFRGSRAAGLLVASAGLSVRGRLARRLAARGARGDRGDVPGWVLVTIMTAGLVVALWAIAGPKLAQLFSDAMDGVTGP